MLNGIDISSHQGDNGIDINKIQTDFVIVKATGARDYINPYCDEHIQQTIKKGLPFGFYHFAHDTGMTHGTAIQEAEFFVKNTKGYFGKGIPILDFEAKDLLKNPQWALDFLQRVEKLTGVKPLFYTYSYVVNSADFSMIYKNDFGLWIANYGNNNRIDGFLQPSPPVSNGFPTTTIFQYSSNTFLSGYNARLDANVFYGTRDTWNKYVKSSGTIELEKPPVTPDPEPSKPTTEGKIKMKAIKINQPVYLRTAPSRNANAITGKPMPSGSVINFNNVIVSEGYIWGEQPRSDGSKGYIALGGIDSFGSVVDV